MGRYKIQLKPEIEIINPKKWFWLASEINFYMRQLKKLQILITQKAGAIYDNFFWET